MADRLQKAKSAGFFARSNTPQSSRKVYAFSKWLTERDQLDLVEKDIAAGSTFPVIRVRLGDGGLQSGTLVVGVTALSFLDEERRVVFVHPYALLAKYEVNDKGQLVYTLDAKHKNAQYVMGSDGQGPEIVRLIDKKSLVLDRTMHEANHPSQARLFDADLEGGNKSPRAGNKSPRPGDKSPRSGAGSSSAAKPKESTPAGGQPAAGNVRALPGVRYRVTVRQGDVRGLDEKRRIMVAVVNDETITLLDPTSGSAAGGSSVSFIRARWPVVAKVACRGDKVLLTTKAERVIQLKAKGSATTLADDIRACREAGLVNAKAEELLAQRNPQLRAEKVAARKTNRFTVQFEAHEIEIPDVDEELDDVEVLNW